MKLDLDLVRKILLDIEEKETVDGYNGTPEISGYTNDIIEYHVRLMDQGGLLSYSPFKGGYFIEGLTWSGHEFIALSKNNKIWEKAKTTMIEKGIAFTIDLAANLMKRFNLDALGL